VQLDKVILRTVLGRQTGCHTFQRLAHNEGFFQDLRRTIAGTRAPKWPCVLPDDVPEGD